MKVFVAQINPTVGDLEGNTQKVVGALRRAKKAKAEVVLFPEMTLSGYPPEDLVLDAAFIDAALQKLDQILPETRGLFAAVGLPRWNRSKKEKFLFDSAAIFADGKLLGFKDKTLLPTYDVFDERRFFEPGKEQPVFEYLGKKIAVTICEDIWQHAKAGGYTDYLYDPVLELKEKKPDLLLNLSASPYSYRRKELRLAVLQAAAKTLACPSILCNQVGANDQLVFDGTSLFLNEKGEQVQVAKSFVEDDLIVDLEAKRSAGSFLDDPIQDLYDALVLGVRDYFHKQGFRKALLGLSGGIDSALVACIAADALGPSNVFALSLPARYSSPQSYSDALEVAKNLGIELKKIDIDSLFQNYLDLLQPLLTLPSSGVVEENLQSRIRGMILMAFSNKMGALLLNTGNKSEFSMGYTTLYGDMCGGLGVLLDVTKTFVYQLAHHANKRKAVIPEAIFQKAPSAELKPKQTDQDTLPPYEILDLVVEDYIEQRLDPEEIAEKRHLPLDFVRDVAHRMHLAEYKRRQAPIGIRVTQKCFSKGRNIPIVQKWMSRG